MDSTPAQGIELSPPVVVDAGRPGETAVLGMVSNRSGRAVDSLQIRITLLDAAGKPLGQVVVTPALSQLDAADVSPFATTFPLPLAPGFRASAELVGSRSATAANVPLQSEILQAEQLADGSWALMGRLTNAGGSSVLVHELAVLALDARGAPTGLLPWTAGPIRIAPRSSQPFVAIGPAAGATEAHVAYARAEVESGERRIEVRYASGPDLRQTSQGEWFITGALENVSSRPVWGECALRIVLDEDLVGLVQVRYPLPLMPGEIRPFSVRVPPLFGAQLRTLDPEELTLDGKPESIPATAAEAALTLLDVEVESFEFTGSRAFLRGRVSNHTSAPIDSPAVFASVRSTEGKVLGALWQVVAPHLAASGGEDFTLAIDLPSQANPALAEYDLRALGIEPER